MKILAIALLVLTLPILMAVLDDGPPFTTKASAGVEDLEPGDQVIFRLEPPRPKAFWFIPVSLFKLEGATTTASWAVRRDPSIAVEADSAFGGAVGLGYQWPNRVAISVQIMQVREHLSTHWVEKPYGASGLALDEGRPARTGFALTLQVPLGAP